MEAVAYKKAPSYELEFRITTQGPPWPPAELVDKDGNYLLVGNILTETPDGVIPIPGAAIVSKNTPGPSRDGFPPYVVVPGSRCTLEDAFSGDVKRCPMIGRKLYANSFQAPNLIPRPADQEPPGTSHNFAIACPEVLPSGSQLGSQWQRESLPLQYVPVWGFQGDDYQYNVETGQAEEKAEFDVDYRSKKPITLKRWLQARGKAKVRLGGWDYYQKAYTRAYFDFYFTGLIPNQVYTLWSTRESQLAGRNPPGPFHLPNIVLSDNKGKGKASYVLENPFPERVFDSDNPQSYPHPSTTEKFTPRIISAVLILHSDYQNWGACGGLLGVGVDIHKVMDVDLSVVEEDTVPRRKKWWY